MRRRMRSDEGRLRYRKRKASVEPIFGVLKEQHNLRTFRMRSLDKRQTTVRRMALHKALQIQTFHHPVFPPGSRLRANAM